MDRIHFQFASLHSQAHREKRYMKHNIARRKVRVKGKKFNCYDLIATTPRTPSIVEVNDRSIAEDHETLCDLCDYVMILMVMVIVNQSRKEKIVKMNLSQHLLMLKVTVETLMYQLVLEMNLKLFYRMMKLIHQ